ncbi:MAG: hypothetical protein WAO52_18165 [Prolixibacteraceae bacterium]
MQIELYIIRHIQWVARDPEGDIWFFPFEPNFRITLGLLKNYLMPRSG